MTPDEVFKALADRFAGRKNTEETRLEVAEFINACAPGLKATVEDGTIMLNGHTPRIELTLKGEPEPEFPDFMKDLRAL